MALITCEDVSFAYEGSTVVSGLNFRVEAGDYLCIAGENGSGKSTLLKGLLRLKQPQNGRIDNKLKANEIGYMPQQTAAQKNFPASVHEVALSGRLNSIGLKPFYSKADKAVVNDNLRKLGIADLKNRCYGELSGGQQQRVLLCRALCAAKKALILDEPEAGLDPAAAQEMYRIIQDINKSGITIIMVSHDIHSAAMYASHILHLKNEQVFFGGADDYRQSEIGKRFWGLGD